MVQQTPQWPLAALEARQQVLDKIPPYARIDSKYWLERYPAGSDVRPVARECGLLTERELEITEQDATAIVQGIATKKWSSVEVTMAFGKRACIAHQLIHCLTDVFLESALSRASELDEYYARTGKLVGPLHGLPFCVKEHYKMKGHISTMSISSGLKSAPATEHCSLNQLFWDSGAVFYVRTNLPQSGMQLETNSFWGQTLNPWNTALSPGGSSGGCSSLIAFGGAPISLAGDIGGSLRAPASNTGLWTLKCNNQRIPREGQGLGMMPGNDGLVGSNGCLSKSLRDLDLFMRVVLGSKPWLEEQSLVPLPWRVGEKKTTYRIGVMWDDGYVLPQPPTRRAIATLVEALRKDPRFEIVKYEGMNHREGVQLAHELYFPDGGATLREAFAKANEAILPLTEWIISHPQIQDRSVRQYWELVKRRDAYRAAYLRHFNCSNIDAILCPVTYGPAPPLGTCRSWSYTCIFNLLDYPGAAFPTGLVGDPEVDLKDQARVYMSEEDKYVSEIYDPVMVKNAPLGLQLVGRRFHEEDLMKLLEEISTLLPLQ